LDDEGRPLFHDLLRHRSRAAFVAFDITELNGRDVSEFPSIERKHILYNNVRSCGRVLVPQHIEAPGVKLFTKLPPRS
jgi:ATP-dependent DNA ligase